ncbi:hypothetical protein PbB2_02216 [Candidatus Phycosocius bacilliformis]|uniref:Uncharacterized protein n=2 Tax=Candidatus Phycosocius bacilliformis TaxID=1445552 RepID=A0A2P2EBT5_9PROT|nr:hypothetical protein PbB2_02216 [Candidatus Phycosocius bacilliformis]
MVNDAGKAPKLGPGGISATTRLMTRLIALAIWSVLVFGLLHMAPPKALPEPVGVAALVLATERPTPPRRPFKIAPNPAASQKPSQRLKPQSEAKSGQTRPVLLPASPTVENLAPLGPMVAGQSTPGPTKAIEGGLPGPAGGQAGAGLTSQAQAIIKAQACARIDIKDRPPDCPPNLEIKRLLDAARGPKYRPENAEAFSRNEMRWRDVPPPCLEDGQSKSIKGGTVCVRVGMIPSRVRSPQEICEAKGIGACAPTPPQAAVNAAIANSPK